jgi:hypothetical protein
MKHTTTIMFGYALMCQYNGGKDNNYYITFNYLPTIMLDYVMQMEIRKSTNMQRKDRI